MPRSRRPTCSACSRHFLVLSLLAVGGAITTAPDMHRYIVAEHHWISDAQFSASVAIAQAAPGPNVLFVAVLGWNVAGPLGALATMSGTLLPSTALTLVATRWGARRQRNARRARVHDRPDAADHRPPGRHRLAAGAALRRQRPARVRCDRPDRRVRSSSCCARASARCGWSAWARSSVRSAGSRVVRDRAWVYLQELARRSRFTQSRLSPAATHFAERPLQVRERFEG